MFEGPYCWTASTIMQLHDLHKARRRWYREEEAEFIKNKCPNCGKQIGEIETFCHYCGSTRINACPKCHYQNNPGTEVCNFCGAPVETVPLPKHDKDFLNQKAPYNIRKWNKIKNICPECGNKIGDTDNYCFRCKSLRVNSCPKCRYQNFPGAKFCGLCGEPIKTIMV